MSVRGKTTQHMQIPNAHHNFRVTINNQSGVKKTMDEKQRQQQGLTIRKAVLGEEHVARAQANEHSFNSEFQDLITRYAWGEIWARPGLDRKTRSLITIAMMIALNRPEELRLHLRGAKNNAVSNDE